MQLRDKYLIHSDKILTGFIHIFISNIFGLYFDISRHAEQNV